MLSGCVSERRLRALTLRFALRSGGLFLLLSFVGISAVLAQGKIAGRVTDSVTGEALIGANVIIDGTTQGTTTNTNGDYVILNVRPGTHALNFSYIGYQGKQVTDVRAVTGQTTRIDVTMREEVLEGQEIVVQADRPLIQKDLTASKTTIAAEEIDALPVEGFLGVLATQAGVSQGADGALHIRGGRSNEISYLVDGMSVGNPFNTNGLATEVAVDAIQEMTVISGAFNAEYGKAMSGIVNLVTKEGGNKYEGTLSAYAGDTFTQNEDIFWTPSSVNASNYTLEATLSGPVPLLRKLQFFVSGRRDVDDGDIYGRNLFSPSDSMNFNPNPDLLGEIQQYIPAYNGPAWYYEIQGKPWYTYADGEVPQGDLVAMNPRQSYNLLAKLTFRPFSGGKIEYSYLRDRTERTPFGSTQFAYRYDPLGVSTVRDWSQNHSLHWTHTLGDKAFYTLRASYATNHYQNYLYKNPYDPRYVSSGRTVGFPGTNFLMGGTQMDQVFEKAESFRAKLDFTRQFGVIHEAKAGVDVQLHSLDRNNFTVLYDGVTYRQPTVEDPSNPSHDVYKNQRVTELAGYVQDKIEFRDFIINAGLRLEYFEPNGLYVPDLLKPKADLAEATAKTMWLPRLGVSFPITETGIIHFSYGHFAQMPSLREMYLNPEFEFPKGQVPTFGNPNMRPERTVQYEVGLQQQIGAELAFDVTGYFKDIRDYLTRQRVRYTTIPGEEDYRIYLNKNYANIRGVTFALTKRRARAGLLSASVDYTYQVAEGNNDNTDAFFFNFLSGREDELEVVPLDFDQRHILSATVALTKPRSWGASFIGRYSTGYPYSPLLFDQNIDDLPNSGRKPAQFRLDAHLYKDFHVRGLGLRVFGKVFNALDNLNENYVFDDTGRATYSLSAERNVHAAWEAAYRDGAYRLPGISTLQEYETRPHYYGSPRQVRIGLTAMF